MKLAVLKREEERRRGEERREGKGKERKQKIAKER